MKKNENLANLFAALGAKVELPTDMSSKKDGMPDLSDLSKFAGTGAMGNPEDMLKSLTGMLKMLPDGRKTDANIIRNIFKDMPGLSEFVDKLSDDDINAGPQALFNLMEKKKKKAAKKARKAGATDETIKAAEDAASEDLDMFIKFAESLIDSMTEFEKDHGIDTSTTAAKKDKGNESTKIKRSPLTAMVIGLILEMGGNPTDHTKQLNKIVENPEELEKRTAKILKKVTRGNPAFLNTYAYLCSANFKLSKVTEALAKDKMYQDQRKDAESKTTHQEDPQPNPAQDIADWKPGKATKQVAKIKKGFTSGKRTPTETTDALKNLTDKAGRNPMVLLEILSALSKDVPGLKK